MSILSFLLLLLLPLSSSFFLLPPPPLSTSLHGGKNAKTGLFTPLVLSTKAVLGESELNKLRGKFIAEHSKVIAKFVDTSESKFGRIALKALFEAADENGDGVLTVDEVRSACNALGFSWIDEDKSETLISRADVDENEVIDFEEFVKTTPKVLRTNLIKLAKENGNDLGFLV
ncbi:hypothetical protein TrVE_jg11613 [Triparma verrucosa]|uniref:EF-hand domain-containing protein n=1 Tax=Triparma verrucosa TaxID=1606542 RepID=A0A9W7BAU2_9STRA|nr:hypothetical protein TrVE_jg11613 [Triparma verrucosa]